MRAFFSGQHCIGAALLLVVSVGTSTPVLAASSAQPPAPHPPFAGHALVFAPGGERVLTAASNPVIERMFAGAIADCTAGDIAVRPGQIAGALLCPGGPLNFALTVAPPRALAEAGQPLTLRLAAHPGACDALCTQRRAAIVAAVQTHEAELVWARVQPKPDASKPAASDAWLQALVQAQQSLERGATAEARGQIQTAVSAQALAALPAEALLDLTLLAAEAGEVVVALSAQHALRTKTAEAGKDPALQALALAAQGLAGEATAATDAALASQPVLDPLPLLRVLVARRHYAQAARLLDRGPLTAEKPPRDLLKLRFGVATLMGDSDGQQVIAERLSQLHPDGNDGPALLAHAWAGQRRFTDAIGLWRTQALKHPKAPVPYGELAALLQELDQHAQRDPQHNQAAQALRAELKKASTSAPDSVARFVTALNLYENGQFAESVKLLEALLQSGQRHARLALPAALANLWLGKQAAAERWIEQAVALGPDDPEVFYGRSLVLRANKPAQAIADLEHYQQLGTRRTSPVQLWQAQRAAAALAMLRSGQQPPAWDRPGPDALAFLPHEHTAALALAATAEQADPAAHATPPAESASAVAAAATEQNADGPALMAASGAAAGPASAAPESAEPEAQPRKWFPALLLAVLAAAMGLRLWLGPQRSSKANRAKEKPPTD